jgi:hypothetical protein
MTRDGDTDDYHDGITPDLSGDEPDLHGVGG